jgi:hypothetical protein
VRNEKQRAEELVKKICGNVDGHVLKQHDHLRSKHDLPRYLNHMRSQWRLLEDMTGERAERLKIFDDKFLLHVVTHVDPFLPHMMGEYRQRKSSTVNKFTIESIQREIDDMEEECDFDVERQCDLSVPGPIATHQRRVQYRQMQIEQEEQSRISRSMDRRQYDPSEYLQQRPVADSRQLPSGMRYDDQQFGEGFNPQRSMTPGWPSGDLSKHDPRTAAEVGETPGVTLGVATILDVILDEVVSSTASVSLSETVINVPEGAAQAEIGETMVEAAPGTEVRRQTGLAAGRPI